jgi:hypothetical protein
VPTHKGAVGTGGYTPRRGARNGGWYRGTVGVSIGVSLDESIGVSLDESIGVSLDESIGVSPDAGSA